MRGIVRFLILGLTLLATQSTAWARDPRIKDLLAFLESEDDPPSTLEQGAARESHRPLVAERDRQLGSRLAFSHHQRMVRSPYPAPMSPTTRPMRR
jgi:hypothetical protein